MARMTSLLLSFVLLVSLALVVAGHKGGKKGGGYIAPQKVIILQAGPSVTYPWVGFCPGSKGKCKKIPKLPRPPFPSFLPPAPPLPAYAPAPVYQHQPPAYTSPVVLYAPQAPAASYPTPQVHHQEAPPAYAPQGPSYEQQPQPYAPQAPQAPQAYEQPAYSQPAPEVHQHVPEVQHHAAPEVHQQLPAAPGPQSYVAPAGAPPAPEYVPPPAAVAPVYQEESIPPLSSYQVAPVPTFETAIEPRPASYNTGAVSSNSWGPVEGPFGGVADEAPLHQEGQHELNGGYANSAPVTVPPVYQDAAVQNEGQSWDAPAQVQGQSWDAPAQIDGQTWDAPPVPQDIQQVQQYVEQDAPQLWADQSSFQTLGSPSQDEFFQDDYAQPSESQQFGPASSVQDDPYQDFIQESPDAYAAAQEEESVQQEYAPADGFGSRIRPRGNLQDRQF